MGKTAAEYWKQSLVIGSCHGLSYDTRLLPTVLLSLHTNIVRREGYSEHQIPIEINPQFLLIK